MIVDFNTVKNEVWEAADILRGSIDAADYKNYILGLLFLKRISDVFIEEGNNIEKETGDKKLAWDEPDEHQFYVPKNARWNNIKEVNVKIGDYLNKACAELEDHNSTMEGVLSTIDFNSDKLGDQKQRDNVLDQLIRHFSMISMKPSDLEEPDMLGRVYEYLIEQFADDAGKKGGEFYTPRKVVQLIVSILNPKEGMRIHDPTCGSGGMLIESSHYIERNGGNPKNITLHGQEKNIGTWGICKMNMLLHNLPDTDIRKGDVIRNPKFFDDNNNLMVYDRVIANPPFSLNKWGQEIANNDGFGRFTYGVPPKSSGDYAFVEHMIASLNQNGKLGVIVPHGVLFRSGAEGKIRQNIVKNDLIEAIIGLPEKLFYGTSIPAAILVINKNKPEERKNNILFISAHNNYQEGKKQNKLRDEDIEKIVSAYNEYKNINKFSKVINLSEIKENDFNLNIPRYVDILPDEEPIDIQEAIKDMNKIESEKEDIVTQMNEYLREMGYDA